MVIRLPYRKCRTLERQSVACTRCQNTTLKLAQRMCTNTSPKSGHTCLCLRSSCTSYRGFNCASMISSVPKHEMNIHNHHRQYRHRHTQTQTHTDTQTHTHTHRHTHTHTHTHT